MSNIKFSQSKGQSLTEFALVVPVLFFLILGAFDLGFYVYANNTVSLSAREGARYAVTRRTNPNVDAEACQRADDTAAALNVTCSISWKDIYGNPSGKNQGSIVTVKVTTVYSPFVPMVGGLLGGANLTLTGQSKMVVE